MDLKTREYEVVLSYIKRLIIDGEITMGSKIPSEREMAETLNISRNSTREALKILEGNGVIEKRHGSGNYMVCNISKSFSDAVDIMLLAKHISEDDISSFRRYMDYAAVNMIFDKQMITPTLVQELGETVDKMKFGTEESESELDNKFHYMVIEATGNQLLISITEMVTNEYKKHIDNVHKKREGILEETIDLHEQIYKAIKDMNREKCLEAVRKHYDIV